MGKAKRAKLVVSGKSCGRASGCRVATSAGNARGRGRYGTGVGDHWPRLFAVWDGAGSAAGNTARDGRWTDAVVRPLFGPGPFAPLVNLYQAGQIGAMTFRHEWGQSWGDPGNRLWTARDLENLPRHNFYGPQPQQEDRGSILRLEDVPSLRSHGVVDFAAMEMRIAQEIAARELYPDLFFRPIAGIAANINDEQSTNEGESHDDK